MKFKATVLSNGKTATGIEVPPAIVDELGAGKRPPVQATVNGYTYPNTIATMDGVYMLSVSAEVRQKAGVAAGDEVEVELVLDTAPRQVTLPPDFAAALAEDAATQSFFAGLSYSNQRRHVLSIEGAKSAETRQRRIAKSVSTLREGRE